jgi:predicted acyltransferase
VNPITIYLANRIIGWDNANKFIASGIATLFPETWTPLIMAIGYVMMGWLFLYFLYSKRIFLKV